MKREIKFRVWTGNEMEYSIVAGIYGGFYINPESKKDGLDPRDTASLSPNNTKYHDETPLMQFTGFKDKDSKDIFEGDILRFSDGRTGEIVWYNDGWFIQSNPYSKMEKSYSKMNKGDGFSKILLRAERYSNLFKGEIIGNIYATPDLL